ncbi:MAG TPA: hypothetical protein VFQ22_08515 [Longimicrobiales bacterium]|nr:hypothetical protein [Longimicrobiales bacterium]
MPAQLTEFAVVLLAISLATERFVVMVKTLVARLQSPGEREIRRRPRSAGAEPAKPRRKGAASALLDRVMSQPLAEKERRVWVLAASLLGAWVTTALVAATPETGFTASLLGRIEIAGRSWPVWFVGLMATGGSAFWAQVVAYASALKDARQALAASGGAAGAPPAGAPGTNGAGDLSELSWADIKRATNLGVADGGR